MLKCEPIHNYNWLIQTSLRAALDCSTSPTLIMANTIALPKGIILEGAIVSRADCGGSGLCEHERSHSRQRVWMACVKTEIVAVYANSVVDLACVYKEESPVDAKSMADRFCVNTEGVTTDKQCG